MKIEREHLVWLRYGALFVIAVFLFMQQDAMLGWAVVAAVLGGTAFVLFLRLTHKR